MWSVYLENFPGEMQQAFWNGRLFYVFLGCLVYLWFFERSCRKTLVYPSVLLLILLINPWMYYYIWRPVVSDYGFARLLWTLPVLVIIAYSVASIIKKIHPLWLKIIVLCAVCVGATQSGQYIYQYTGSGTTGFVKAENLYHLPGIVISTVDYLLERTDTPWIVTDMGISPYIRQYSSKIKQFAGRYLSNGDGVRKAMADELMKEEPDLEWIHDRMTDRNYEYFVYPPDNRGIEYYENEGFHLLKEIESNGERRNVYKIKYSYEFEPEDSSNNHVAVPIYLYPGKTYRLFIDHIYVNTKNADSVSVRLYDCKQDEEITYESIKLNQYEMNQSEMTFTIPDNDSEKDRYKILVYAGMHDHTENVGVSYDGIFVEEIRD